MALNPVYNTFIYAALMNQCMFGQIWYDADRPGAGILLSNRGDADW